MNRIKEDSHQINASCPTCHAELDGSVDMNAPGQRPPREGDFSVCAHCGEPARFGPDLKLEKISNHERETLVSQYPEIAKAIMFIKASMNQDEKIGEKYVDQFDDMQSKVKEWKAAHPDLDISIQYNYQNKVAVIGTLKDGINSKFITVNDNAMTMFKELGWLDDGPTMPTIIMVRVVLENTFGKDE